MTGLASRLATAAALVMATALATAATAWSQTPVGVPPLLGGPPQVGNPATWLPSADPFALSQGTGQSVVKAPMQTNPEPPLKATPQERCGEGSRPEPDIQGRVPAGAAASGLWCNLQVVSHQGVGGGYKTLRYVDAQGHECAYYDTSLLFPFSTSAKADGNNIGVVVLDMANPSVPVQTDMLSDPVMQSPHESLNLNAKRGLLAAALGNPAYNAGMVSIYDVSKDCRHPVLESTSPIARFGHESGFAPDGKTFYVSNGYGEVTAVDVTDPAAPHVVWDGNEEAHGLSLSEDGARAYVADNTGSLTIVDTSDIQQRKPNPQVREISRLTWTGVSIPQNAIPFERDGKPYLLEFDEFGDTDHVGAARIIDIGNEAKPQVIADLRLAVNNAEGQAASANDPGHGVGQSFTAHYCDVSGEINPTVVACSFIASGLRVFDISDLRHPREMAYFVPPTKGTIDNEYNASAFSMDRPAIVASRREIWFTDAPTGFWVVRIAPDVWPVPSNESGAAARETMRNEEAK